MKQHHMLACQPNLKKNETGFLQRGCLPRRNEEEFRMIMSLLGVQIFGKPSKKSKPSSTATPGYEEPEESVGASLDQVRKHLEKRRIRDAEHELTPAGHKEHSDATVSDSEEQPPAEDKESSSQFDTAAIDKKSIAAEDQSVFSQDSFGPSSQQESSIKVANSTSTCSQMSSLQITDQKISLKSRSKRVIEQELQSISKGWRQPTQSDINTLFLTVNQSARALTATTQKFIESNQHNRIDQDLETMMESNSEYQTPGKEKKSSAFEEELDDQEEATTAKSTPTDLLGKRTSHHYGGLEGKQLFSEQPSKRSCLEAPSKKDCRERHAKAKQLQQIPSIAEPSEATEGQEITQDMISFIKGQYDSNKEATEAIASKEFEREDVAGRPIPISKPMLNVSKRILRPTKTQRII